MQKRSDIRKRKEAVCEKIARILGELKVAKAKLEALQDECTHPHMRHYSAMGEIGNICDDCGYQD